MSTNYQKFMEQFEKDAMANDRVAKPILILSMSLALALKETAAFSDDGKGNLTLYGYQTAVTTNPEAPPYRFRGSSI
tara:strand:- start:287 stop:517 length:231 start_codon:yes stop_codon:yes gene_type:complete